MSDPSLALFDAMKAAFDTAALAGQLGASHVRVYDITPRNAAQSTGKPYVILGQVQITPDLAQCIDGSVAHATADIWSLTDPAGTREAKAIAAAVLGLMAPVDAEGSHVPPTWSLPGFVIRSALPEGVDHLFDPADQSAHSIVRVQYAIDPA